MQRRRTDLNGSRGSRLPISADSRSYGSFSPPSFSLHLIECTPQSGLRSEPSVRDPKALPRSHHVCLSVFNLDSFVQALKVLAFNGKPIKNLSDLAKMVENCNEEFLQFNLEY